MIFLREYYYKKYNIRKMFKKIIRKKNTFNQKFHLKQKITIQKIIYLNTIKFRLSVFSLINHGSYIII